MAIVVDSGCDFTDELKEKKAVTLETVPLTLQIGDAQYIDDGSIDIDRYLQVMAAAKETPKTAAPSPELFLERYRAAGSVFVVTISSHLSASYNNAMLAKKLHLDEFGEKFIHVFNSLSASVGETLIALQINDLLKENRSDAEIVQRVESFISGMQTYFILENYDTLVKNGRLNPYVARVAQMLSIKPICYAVEGRMAMLDKARGYQRAIGKLITAIEKTAVDFENRVLAISHVKCLDKALAFKEKIMQRLPFKEVIIVEASGLVATYADKDGLVIGL